MLPSHEIPRVYQANETLRSPLPVALKQDERALLISIHSRCRFCGDSMSFYKTLKATVPANVKVVVVGRENANSLNDYLTRHAVQADVVAQVSPDYFRTDMTPI